MKVSVVIPSIGRKSLFECLSSLKNQEYEEYEVLVVSPKKEIKEEIEKYGAKFIFSPVSNVSFQKNLGIRECNGENVCFIDDDAVADKKWIKNLVENLEDRKVGCVGGKIELKFEVPFPKEFEKLDNRIFRGFLGGTFLGEEKIELNKPLIFGSNMCIRKEIFDKIGYFDEELGRTPFSMKCNEDIEIQERILKEGFKIIYEPKAIVYHIISKEKLTKNYFLKRGFWQGYSDVLMKWKEEFSNLGNIFPANFFVKRKILEILFESMLEEDLEKEILAFQKIGRGVAFLEINKLETKIKE